MANFEDLISFTPEEGDYIPANNTEALIMEKWREQQERDNNIFQVNRNTRNDSMLQYLLHLSSLTKEEELLAARDYLNSITDTTPEQRRKIRTALATINTKLNLR